MDDEALSTIEVKAATVEDAIEIGLARLQCDRDSVEITVLDEGHRGLLGFGSRQAIVRLSLLGDRPAKPAAQTPPADELELSQVTEPVQDDAPLTVARDTVRELLEKMDIPADVSAHYSDTQYRGQYPIIVEINGRDLSILLGRKQRNNPLDALQYLARMIISRELGHGITLVLDVQGHRKRRETSLRRLARRMAEQAITTGRRQVLEPMPARDRRIIHLELRDHPQVTTESIGEEPRRKVTIIPKQ